MTSAATVIAAGTDPRYRWFREEGDEASVDALFIRLTGAPLTALTDSDAPHPARGGTAPLDAGVARLLRRLHDGPRVPFLDATVGVVADQLAALDALSDHHAFLASSPAMVESLARQLLGSVEKVLLRAQVQLMHEFVENGRLTAATSGGRFEEFERHLATPEGQAEFRDRFPVAVPQAVRSAEQYLAHLEQVVSRTSRRAPELERCFGISQGARLVAIDMGAGDRHNGGQTVSMLTYEDGSRLVYKPRPMDVDMAYNSLLGRIGQHAGHLGLPGLTVVGDEDHGWCEYLETGTAPAGGATFFRAAGRLMAMLHLLRANDMHYQNFLLKDGLPVLVDVETLLGAVMPHSAQVDQRALAVLTDTVQATGMLPTMLDHPSGNLPGIDVGALGYQVDQVSPFSTLVVLDEFTDRMRFELQHLSSSAPSPFPTVAPDVEITAVVEGFSEMYRWAIDHRDLLADWVEELFGGVRVRYLAENTQRYSQVLRLTTNPEVQSSHAAHRAIVHRIAVRRPGVPDAILRSETRQLLDGDVPCFSVHASLRDIFDAAGPCAQEALREAPLAAALRVIRAVSDSALALNVWIIRLSYIAKLPRSEDRTGFRLSGGACDEGRDEVPGRGEGRDEVAGRGEGRDEVAGWGEGTDRRPDPTRAAARGAALDLVHQTCERIARAAVPEAAPWPTSWIGASISPTAYQYWKVGELSIDLYAGSSGLARTLGFAGVALDQPHWRALARSYFSGTLRSLLQMPGEWGNLRRGTFTGLESLLRGALDTGHVLADDELCELGARAWAQLPRLLESPQASDVMFGSAGLLGASVALARRAGAGHRQAFLDVAEQAHRRLVTDLFDASLADVPGGHPTQYSGYGHGGCGVYAQLAEYGSLVGADVTRPLVERLLEHERGFFAADVQEWRISDPGSQGAFGWCHGAPGMLLAKAQVRASDPELAEAVAGDIEVLRATTLELSLGHNASACHGDVGNLWILAHVAQLAGDDQLAAQVAADCDRFVLEVLPRALENKLNRHSVNHSLMLGQAGVASLLLSEYGSTDLPPVLWFA